MQIGSLDIQRLNVEVVPLRVSEIKLSRFRFRQELSNLEDLKRSIAEKGLLHPIIVRIVDRSSYEVVTGSRRLCAFRELGISTIPAIITNLTDQETFELILTENVQRETLSPLEEARAFYSYVGPKDRNCFGYGKVSELAKRIGKSQEYVSNRIRLLRLPEALLQKLFLQKHFTVSHAEELASLSDYPDVVEELGKMLLNEKISVRELERAVPLVKSGVDTKRAVELARLELDLKVTWNYNNGVREDVVQILMKRTELILKTALSYVDNAGADLEYDRALHDTWIANVRLKVHDAINGVILSNKVYKQQTKVGSARAVIKSR
ncbi:MAG TPA: ParB/RepB/Spo0J family partition protein [Nitrososphaerales archaeon]|nr:ParB/RepB/Spo0J family partition protein [Nitrososphaerales archaeon]